MTNINRRELVGLGAAGAVGLAAGVPLAKTIADRQIVPAGAAVTPVVVVGGGMAGVSVAKYIRLWSNKTIPVVLLEANTSYSSNIMSNLVLTGQKTMSNLNYSYSKLASTHGVQVITGAVVTGITPGAAPGALGGAAGTVTYKKGTAAPVTIAYSRLVVAPGIDFLPFSLSGPGDTTKVVHAWTAASPAAGAQMTSLRNQLVAMPMDGTFIMTIPPAPYRCPPGPYERACLVADWIKKNRRSAGNTNPQVIVLDANAKILAEPDNFANAFKNIHRGVIKYIPYARLDSVNVVNGSAAGTIVGTVNFTVTAKDATANGWTTDADVHAWSLQANVVNVIPAHTTAALWQSVGLATSATPAGGKFCPVWVDTYESKNVPYVHVLGDASATTQPKAGHIANQEAKVAADAIVRLLLGRPAADKANIRTNSSCYSPITMTTASWLAVVYKYDNDPSHNGTAWVGAPNTYQTMVAVGPLPYPSSSTDPVNGPTEAPSISTGNFSQMNTWFSVLMQDTFA